MAQLIAVLIPLSLALITYGIGISITFSQVRDIWLKPKAFLVALASQMIALPIIAFIIAVVVPAPVYIKVGLVILAASPGGSVSGFLTFLFRGNIALSITLTSVNAFLTLFTIPLIVNFALYYFDYVLPGNSKELQLSFMHTLMEISRDVLIPAVLGIATQHFFPVVAEKLSKVIKLVMTLVLAGVFILMALGGEGSGNSLTLAEALFIAPYCILLCFACMFTGYVLPKFFGLDYASRVTTAIESGVHNTTLALIITHVLLQSDELAKPVLVYALLSFWCAASFTYITRLRSGRSTIKGDIAKLKTLLKLN